MQPGYHHSAPFSSAYLRVDPVHTIHYSQSGNPTGKPVLFLHGGPGYAPSPSSTLPFSPSLYRVVLPSQRGAGLSSPRGSLLNNTTADLISDIELLRRELRIRKWHMVFGGSWGSTLGLAYAQAHPGRCGSLVLRGVFLGSREESERFERGAEMFFPEAFERYRGFVGEGKRGDLVGAYHALVGEGGGEGEMARRAAFEFERLEGVCAGIWGGEDGDGDGNGDGEDWEVGDEERDRERVASVRILTHYMVNGCFLGADELLEGCDKIKDIPTRIAQGRMDIICPPRAAFELHKRLPKSELHWLRRSGHSAQEPDTLRKLIQFCDELGKKDYHLE